MCKIKGCGPSVLARNLCDKHYRRWHRTGDTVLQPKTKKCGVSSCDKLSYRREYCTYHWQNFYRHGDPEFKLKGCCKVCSGTFLKRSPSHLYCDECVGTHRRRQKADAQNRRRVDKSSNYNREDIFSRDKYICQICKLEVDMSLCGRDPMMASIDHTIPISRGGQDVDSNVQLSHLACNVKKNNKKEWAKDGV